jgi:amidase
MAESLPHLPHPELEELTVADLAAAMADGRLTSVDLVTGYLDRIDVAERHLDLRSVIATDPEALDVAAALDRERADGRVRGPLHGIPVLLKDNIDTDPDRSGGLATTAGSLALAGCRPTADATVAARLREAGAVILGKANLSEWANFRSTRSSSGWSAVGGACRNPYVLDRTPCGSSSGSGAAVSANLAAVAVGTETDGSIVCPSSVNGIVGIKPTVGLTSRAGVVPISRTQDTVGPMARTVADAAAVLGVMAGPDARDPATTVGGARRRPDYRAHVDRDGLRGARIGVARQLFTASPSARAVIEAVLAELPGLGVDLVDPVELPSFEEYTTASPERDVLLLEFKTTIAAYLATRVGDGPRTLGDLIRFNADHADRELRWFGQELFEAADERGGVDEAGYGDRLAAARRISRTEGLDAVLERGGPDGGPLDAVIAPTLGPAWTTDPVNGDHSLGGSASYAAMAGYPLITVPMGAPFGLPVGLSFMGRPWSEPTLIRLASGFEATLGARRRPGFLPTLART